MVNRRVLCYSDTQCMLLNIKELVDTILKIWQKIHVISFGVAWSADDIAVLCTMISFFHILQSRVECIMSSFPYCVYALIYLMKKVQQLFGILKLHTLRTYVCVNVCVDCSLKYCRFSFSNNIQWYRIR